MEKHHKGNTKKRKIKTGGWVSKNRLLVGDTKNVTARNPNFDTDETKLLITLYGDPKFQKKLITSHRKNTVIKTLADEMAKNGYSRSVEELSTRIKNLKCFYNRLKKEHESGLSNGQPTWKHYEAMDTIMNRRIFSVHPDEIAAPSLKYRLEQEKYENEKFHFQDSDIDKNLSVEIELDSLKKNKVCYDNSLLAPKEEIIDINDSDDEFKTENSRLTAVNLQKSCSILATISSNNIGSTESSKEQQYTKANQNQFGKISLIPTNLLVENKKSDHNNCKQIQTTTSNTFPYAQNHTSNGMKVLLLNTANKGNSSTLLSQNNPPQQSTFIENNKKTEKIEDDIANFENLFLTLVAAQAESIDIQQQQLEIERERFVCQKSLADKIFKVFPPSLIGS